jgi:hypothetical protein
MSCKQQINAEMHNERSHEVPYDTAHRKDGTYRVGHQIEVRKGRAEVGAVDVGLPGGLGKVQAVTPRAEHVHGVVPGHVAQADRQYRLALAEDVRAPAKGGDAVLLVHGVHPPVGNDVPAHNVRSVRNDIYFLRSKQGNRNTD